MKAKSRKLPPSCPSCDAEHPFVVQEQEIEQEFRGDSLTVTADCAVCEKCGFAILLPGQVDALRLKTADAYRRREKLLTSDEIVSRRRALGMTQQQFADMLGVGVASVKRWEGAFVQDRSKDNLMRDRTRTRAEGYTVYPIGLTATPLWHIEQQQIVLCSALKPIQITWTPQWCNVGQVFSGTEEDYQEPVEEELEQPDAIALTA